VPAPVITAIEAVGIIYTDLEATAKDVARTHVCIHTYVMHHVAAGPPPPAPAPDTPTPLTVEVGLCSKRCFWPDAPGVSPAGKVP